MTNKQYIYSGTGSPIDNAVDPDTLTAHYLDTANDDIWMHDGTSWQRIYVGGSLGNAAFYSAYNPPSSPPTGGAIHVSFGGGVYKVHVSSQDADDQWLWVEMSATATV